MKPGYYLWEPFGDHYLITNDLGRYAFLSHEDFNALSSGQMTDGAECAQMLEERGFVYRGDTEIFVGHWANELTSMKRCLFTATQLFILVLTTACNQRCVYCQAGDSGNVVFMSKETARKAIDIAASAPVDFATIEFQGGEPTLNPEVLKDAVLYAKEVFRTKGKHVNFALATNLTGCNAGLLSWLSREGVHISTSLDGPQVLHNLNRPLAGGEDSYARFLQGVRMYNDACAQSGVCAPISAIQTTTRYSFAYAKQIIDEYVRQDIKRLYIRPLTPLGCARDRWAEIGYSPDEYLEFYRQILSYMIELCLAGTDVREITASLYLRRILMHESVAHTEYRSPCGAGIGQMAVNCDGKIYTCDEARMLANMGDDAFLLGTVDNSYQELIQSPVAHAVCVSSCIEALPICSDCAFSPFCAVCPVVNYGLEGDIISHDVGNYRCAIAKGILRMLFEIIQRNDPTEMDVLWKWAEEQE